MRSEKAIAMEDAVATVQDTSDTSGRLIAADKVEGTTVYNRAGEKLGSVQDIMLDKMSGKVCYAVLSFGGFLGMGTNEYPMPWEKLTYDTNMGGFVVDIDKTTLEQAPVYREGSMQEADWRAVDTHYGTHSTI
jgi:sporulation protein YlmC with PRC-barrel domain